MLLPREKKVVRGWLNFKFQLLISHRGEKEKVLFENAFSIVLFKNFDILDVKYELNSNLGKNLGYYCYGLIVF